jgi:hypothetical protein
MCEVTTALKARFCKDTDLSIQVFSEPYFTDRLTLFGKNSEYEDFLKMLESYKTEEDFFAEYNRIIDAAITYINESEALIAMNAKDFKDFKVDTKGIPDRDAYKDMNLGHRFLSIDMSKANYTSLCYFGKRYGKKFFEGTYEEFLGMFTNNEHIISSKYIRQFIFGNCNCKRTRTFEKIMMLSLYNYLVSMLYADYGYDNLLDYTYSIRTDELLFDITELDDDYVTAIKRVVAQKMEEEPTFRLKTEIYTLRKFKDEDIYVKQFDDDSFELKKVDSEFAPQVYRYMRGLPKSDLDLYFFHKGILAKWETHKELILE